MGYILEYSIWSWEYKSPTILNIIVYNYYNYTYIFYNYICIYIYIYIWYLGLDILNYDIFISKHATCISPIGLSQQKLWWWQVGGWAAIPERISVNVPGWRISSLFFEGAQNLKFISHCTSNTRICFKELDPYIYINNEVTFMIFYVRSSKLT